MCEVEEGIGGRCCNYNANRFLSITIDMEVNPLPSQILFFLFAFYSTLATHFNFIKDITVALPTPSSPVPSTNQIILSQITSSLHTPLHFSIVPHQSRALIVFP